jgi:predicted nucleic acid-binding protein
MIMVDISVWVDFFNGKITRQTDLLDQFLASTVIVVGDLILAALLQGFRHDKDYQTAKSLLEELEPAQLCNIELAIKSAQNDRALRRKGMTARKTVDGIIATFCIENEMPLLFSDRDFVPYVENLRLIDAAGLF